MNKKVSQEKVPNMCMKIYLEKNKETPSSAPCLSCIKIDKIIQIISLKSIEHLDQLKMACVKIQSQYLECDMCKDGYEETFNIILEIKIAL